MVKKDKGKVKNDYFSVVMTVQFIVSAVIAAMLLFSVKSDGKLASVLINEYNRFMADDITADEAADAFRSIREYAAVFSPDAEAFTVYEETTAQPGKTIGGGADIEFTSLDALEGICFDRYIFDMPYCTPLDDYRVTSPFGYRISPVSGNAGIHTGIDMAADYASPIYAFADGTVADASYDNSYGYYVKLLHEDNFVTIYAHCSELCVSAGDKVRMGDTISLVGSTGDSTGNHLHFEMRKDNIRVNPAYLLFNDEA